MSKGAGARSDLTAHAGGRFRRIIKPRGEVDFATELMHRLQSGTQIGTRRMQMRARETIFKSPRSIPETDAT
jgi:hypothetical protein